jgi:hypothetical protein
MKLIVKSLKPRNPLVAASRRRHAGAHRSAVGSQRQREQRSLRRELEALRHSP